MKRRRNGYVLLFVLFALLALSLAAAGYYTMASKSQLTSVDLLAQEVAVQRAQFAAEQAVLDVRAGAISVSGLSARSAPDGVAGCGGYNCVTKGPVDYGRDGGLGLSDGAGLQWDYVVYKSDQIGTPSLRYTIQANGYYGFGPTSVTYATARVEVELDVGYSSNGIPTDPNGASGAM